MYDEVEEMPITNLAIEKKTHCFLMGVCIFSVLAIGGIVAGVYIYSTRTV
jgi:hypothetical protein